MDSEPRRDHLPEETVESLLAVVIAAQATVLEEGLDSPFGASKFGAELAALGAAVDPEDSGSASIFLTRLNRELRWLLHEDEPPLGPEPTGCRHHLMARTGAEAHDARSELVGLGGLAPAVHRRGEHDWDVSAWFPETLGGRGFRERQSSIERVTDPLGTRYRGADGAIAPDGGTGPQ